MVSLMLKKLMFSEILYKKFQKIKNFMLICVQKLVYKNNSLNLKQEEKNNYQLYIKNKV